MATVQPINDHPQPQDNVGQARKNRVPYLDVARGIAIFLMILQHAVIVYAVDEGESDPLGKLFLLAGTAPAAPVFLLIMGIFSARPGKGLSRSLSRGLKLIFLGYVLNFVRFCIPILAGAELLGVSAEHGELLFCLGMVDILQMAGLSLIVLALLRKYLPDWRVWLAVAFAVLILSPCLWGRWSHVPGTQLLWGIGENVFFPLFPWLFYPLLGMVLSSPLRDPQRHGSQGIFRWGWLLLGSGVLMLLLPTRGLLVLGDYFRSGVTTHVIMTGFVLVWLGLCRFVTGRLQGQRVLAVLEYWSRHVTVIYVVQWILIGWGTLAFNSNALSSPIAVLIGLSVVLLTHFGVRIGSVVYDRSRARIRSESDDSA